MAVFFDLERPRPAAFDRIAQTVQRPDARVSAPREHQLARAAAADHLVVEQVRRHPNERQIADPLADDLVTGRERDQVRETFERNAIAGPHERARSHPRGWRIPLMLERRSGVALGEAGHRRARADKILQFGELTTVIERRCRSSARCSSDVIHQEKRCARHVRRERALGVRVDQPLAARPVELRDRERRDDTRRPWPDSVPWRRWAARCEPSRRRETGGRTASAPRRSCACR